LRQCITCHPHAGGAGQEEAAKGMMKFRGQYRIESTRLKGWDYSSAGYYYVTICTKDKHPNFGSVEDGEVKFSSIGEIAERFWIDIPRHYSKVEIDEFVVMPNHVHGIVVISSIDMSSVETPHVASLLQPKDGRTQFGPLKPGSLSKIIQGYKAAVTRQVRLMGEHDFAWQSRFYDHIIRNNEDFGRIRKYIQDNPIKWELDEYYSK
jgi:putative transposase